MNIAFFYENEISPYKGGTESVTYILSHHFKEKGLKVIYIIKNKVNIPDKDNSTKTFYIPNVEQYDSIENFKFINEIVNNEKIDIIINQCAYTNCVKLFRNDKINAKIITCLHFQPSVGLSYFNKMFDLKLDLKKPSKFVYNLLRRIKLPYNKQKIWNIKKKQYKFIAEHSDAFVLLSEKFKDNILKFIPKNLYHKIYYITNPIKKRTIINREKENSILFVGRLEYSSKRVDLAIKIWSIIEKKHKDWSFNIIGDGEERSKLEDLVKKLHLERVFFHGQCNPEKFYNKSKILILTSIHEGLGLVLLEALQYKVVPFAFDTYESIHDIINNKQNGIIIEPFNLKKYAKELENIIMNEDLLKRLSQNNDITLKKFDIDYIYTKWINLFKKLTEQ